MLLLGTGTPFSAPLAAQIVPAADATRPMSPADSLARVRLPSDLVMELVAAEPMVTEPSGLTFDERGRLFVCELHGYNLEGHLDIQELNKTGKLDTSVRRVRADDKLVALARSMSSGTIKLLYDDDGDGRMDRAVTWADKLPICHGIVAARGGIIATCTTRILYLADRDGDDQAEVRETLYEGFPFELIERAINTPTWGPDHWIYVGGGGGNGTITGPNLKAPVALGNTDFRIRSDGRALEPVTGRNETFGMTMTRFGDRFLTSTSLHARYAAPLPYRYLVRNPYVPSPPSVIEASPMNNVRPISQPDPWRLKRSQDPAWVRFYGQRETGHDTFTAACGQLVYGADLLPAAYQDSLFVCEPARNLIHRCTLVRDGAGYRAEHGAGREEFLASSDQWFRPINLRLGPDGAIYVVDMYRAIIEDYSAIPRHLQQQYDLLAGQDRGRIWRIRPAGQPPARPVIPPAASVAEWVRRLEHPNEWWRSTAQRLLLERKDPSCIEPLRHLLNTSPSDAGRVYAMYTLAGLEALRPVDLYDRLADASYGVRVHALRLAEPWLDKDQRLLQRALERAEDPDASVRLQAALSLGESRDAAATARLADMASRYGQERWMSAAILSSAAGREDALLARLSARPSEPGSGRLAVLTPLAASMGARGDDEQIGRGLAAIAELKGGDAPEVQTAVLRGLAEGCKRRRPARKSASATARTALSTLLTSPAAGVRLEALAVTALLGLHGDPIIARAFDQAAADAADAALPLETRLAAVSLLSSSSFDRIAPLAEALLNPREPAPLQLAVIAACERFDDPRVVPTLLQGWEGYSPEVRSAVLDALAARTDRLLMLLEAVEQGTILPTALSDLHRVRLLESKHPAIRTRAAAVLEGAAATRPVDPGFERFRAALNGPHDTQRGRKVFDAHCMTCHRVQDRGFAVGPDLGVTRTRPDEGLLADILDPSARITSGFQSYLVETGDGRILTGVLADESATSVTIRYAGGGSDVVLRKDIQSMRSLSLSIMPANFAELMSPQEAVDLIAYLRSAFGDVLPAALTLFDDEPDILRLLNEGDGRIELKGDGAFSGKVALAVTPLQRHSSRIPGWQFPIVENPGPGEYRYLRWAWKTVDARGVMIELADGGRWPAPDRPVRRYYSGANTSKWKAREVSKEPPREWTVVTVDLWKDCGAFTLTGMAPTAMGGEARFDRIELLRSLQAPPAAEPDR
ncbi:MAG: hypothetical protein AMXMBFR83_07120 [Phycisphaerae bacterium]